ncbi:MAG: glycosyltransferase family 2 protein [Candidatus Theseobacter exili]|nr:glycosyltransferase family 2 protein [Candidatus Theseobacter exili]
MITSRISIVIPAYNEENTISSLLDRIVKTDLPYEKEIIVTDDGSTDSTVDKVNEWYSKIPTSSELNLILLNVEHKGKGSAVRHGIECSTGDIVLIQDADLEYTPSDYKHCIEPFIVNDAKVVYGSRELLKTNKQSSFLFHMGGLIVTYWINLLFGSKLTDEPTCYKLFKGSLIRSVPFIQNGFGWEPEITAKMLRLGYEIIEVPIHYSPRNRAEGKKIRWTDGIIALLTALYWRFKSFKQRI